MGVVGVCLWVQGHPRFLLVVAITRAFVSSHKLLTLTAFGIGLLLLVSVPPGGCRCELWTAPTLGGSHR